MKSPQAARVAMIFLLAGGGLARGAEKDGTPFDAICKKASLVVGVAVDGDIDEVSTDMNSWKPSPLVGYPPYLIPVDRVGKDDLRAIGLDLQIIELIEKGIQCPKGSPRLDIYYSDFDNLADRLRFGQFDLIVAAISQGGPSLTFLKGLSASIPYTRDTGMAIAGSAKLVDSLRSCSSMNEEGARLKCFLQGKDIFALSSPSSSDGGFSYVTGLPKADQKKLRTNVLPMDTLEDVLGSATFKAFSSSVTTGVESDGLILLDYPVLKFLSTWTGADKDTNIRGWQFLPIAGGTGTDDASRYLLFKTAEVVMTRDSDGNLLQVINQILNTARRNHQLDDIQNSWLAYDLETHSKDERHLIRKATEAPTKPKPQLEFGASGGIRLKPGVDKDVGADIKLSYKMPRSVQTAWGDLRQVLFNIPCFGLNCFDQAGLAFHVKESAETDPGASVKITQSTGFGPFWRFHVIPEHAVSDWFKSLDPWGEIGMNLEWRREVSTDGTSSSSKTRFRTTFVPAVGLELPIVERVKLLPSVSLDDTFMTSGHPAATLTTKLDLEVGLD